MAAIPSKLWMIKKAPARVIWWGLFHVAQPGAEWRDIDLIGENRPLAQHRG